MPPLKYYHENDIDGNDPHTPVPHSHSPKPRAVAAVLLLCDFNSPLVPSKPSSLRDTSLETLVPSSSSTHSVTQQKPHMFSSIKHSSADKNNFSPELDASGPTIHLIRRASHLRTHPGQLSLPGGRFDEDADQTILDTAMRETAEEVCLVGSYFLSRFRPQCITLCFFVCVTGKAPCQQATVRDASYRSQLRRSHRGPYHHTNAALQSPTEIDYGKRNSRSVQNELSPRPNDPESYAKQDCAVLQTELDFLVAYFQNYWKCQNTHSHLVNKGEIEKTEWPKPAKRFLMRRSGLEVMLVAPRESSVF